VVFPIPDGPSKQTTSPSFSIFKDTLLTSRYILKDK